MDTLADIAILGTKEFVVATTCPPNNPKVVESEPKREASSKEDVKKKKQEKKEEPPPSEVVISTTNKDGYVVEKENISMAEEIGDEDDDTEAVEAVVDDDEEEATVEDASTMNDETVASGEEPKKESSNVAVVDTSAVLKKKGKPRAAAAAKRTITKRKKKCRKPPNYPKRPLSAYNIFFKETREKIITSHGRTNFQEMVRLIAAYWRDATQEEKKKYDAMAAEDLTRYKKAVSTFEKEEAARKQADIERQAILDEKNREAERRALEAQQQQQQQQKQQQSLERASRVRNDGNGRFGEDSRNAATAGMGGGGAGGGRYPFGLGRHEALMAGLMNGAGVGGGEDLEMARLRLEQDLRSLEETRALRLRQMELAQAHSSASPGLRGAGMYGSRGGTGLNENLELELQRRFLSGGGGTDSLAMANEQEFRQRLAMLRNQSGQFAEDQLLRESNLRAALGGGDGFRGRFDAYSSLLGRGGQNVGSENPYEEILLREQMLRRERELLLNSGGASLYGGGMGGGALGSFGLSGVSSGLLAHSAVADADMYTNVAAAGLASLRGRHGSYIPGSHLERLSDEELRALSSGRNAGLMSKGASAFNRVDGDRGAVNGERM